MPLDLVTFNTTMHNLGNFGPNCHLAVAVSGGPDSMVLCHLAQNWLKNYHSGQITALIIDHGLRPESNHEAHLTQIRLEEMGIKSVIIPWDGQKPTTRIQEIARQKRYSLLETWCLNNGVIYLLTGHHLDDQWETIVSRLQKKSDLAGLQGILSVTYRHFGKILRPLLNVTKQEILEYAKIHTLEYVVDPSNCNLKYQRAYLRQNRAELEQQILSTEKIQTLTQNSIHKTKETFQELTRFIVESVQIHPLGYIQINRDNFRKLNFELQIEFFRKLASCMATTAYPLQKSKAENALYKIEADQRTTLAGWYIVPKKQIILIAREHRAMLPALSNQHKNIRVDRFIVSPKSLSKNYSVNLEKTSTDLPSYIKETIPENQTLTLNFLKPLLP